jgi:hypothetical protein
MAGLMNRFVSLFVRCWHGNRGPLITLRPETIRTGAAAVTGTYSVCLSCGKEFPYDWNEMRAVRTHRRTEKRSL